MVEAAKNGLEYRPREDGSAWSLVRKERRLVLDVEPQALGHPDHARAGRLAQPASPGRRAMRSSSRRASSPIRSCSQARRVRELGSAPRSTAQVLYYLANGVEVPPEHLAEGVAIAPVGPDGQAVRQPGRDRGLFTVHACRGHKPPETAYVAVKYRGYWYYIDDRDQASKATFALVLQISRLDFARQQPAAPVPDPAGRKVIGKNGRARNRTPERGAGAIV